MNRHRFDLISLFFGLLFTGLAVTAAFVEEDIAAFEARWVWPVLLVVGGLAIVAFSLQRNAGQRASPPILPDSEPAGRTTADEEPYDPID